MKPSCRSKIRLAGAVVLALLLGCDAKPPATRESGAVPPPPPPAAARPENTTLPPTETSAAPHRERRSERRSERAQQAFAAGPVAVADAQRGRLHGRLVEFDATVEKLLRADRRGLQHQRFVVRTPGAGTLLIAHNTELAGEVPLAVGDRVRIRGLYEWNAKGGVVHWTHHDPYGGAAGGWIRAAGKTYQ